MQDNNIRELTMDDITVRHDLEEEQTTPEALDAIFEGVIAESNFKHGAPGTVSNLALKGMADVFIPSEQLVSETVANNILHGVMDLSVSKLLDVEERQTIVKRIITALETERNMQIAQYKTELFNAMMKGIKDPDFTPPTSKKEEAMLDEDDRAVWFEYKAKREDAEKTIPHFRAIPHTVCTAVLVASGAVKAITHATGHSEKDMLLLYRIYSKDGTPTLWAPIDTENKKPLSEIAHYTSGLNARLKQTELEQMITLLIKQTPITYVPKKDNNILFVGNGVVDCRGIAWNQALGRNTDKDGNIAKFYPYGTEEAEKIIAEEYPMSFGSPYNFHPVDTLVLPVFHNDEDGTDWNIIDGIKELFEEDEDYKWKYLFQNLQAGIRRTNYGRGTIHANKSGGAGGGNGKSTFLIIKTQLIGQQYVLNVSIAEMGRDKFALEKLPGMAGVIAHENEGTESDKYEVKRFKELCRCEDAPIEVQRKHKEGVTVWWTGSTDWAMNEGKINPTDPSDSVYSCVEVIEYSKSFRDAKERKYIKDKYVRDTTALEYLLWYLIVMVPWSTDGKYDADILARLEPAKAAFRAESRPAMTFLNEVLLPSTDAETGDIIPPALKLSRIPADVLYKIFQSWGVQNNMRALPNASRFKKDVERWANDHKREFVYIAGKVRMAVDDLKDTHDDPAIVEHINNLYDFVEYGQNGMAKGTYKWRFDTLKDKRFQGGLMTIEEYSKSRMGAASAKKKENESA